ncbi:MAG: YdeI/OmpD-associated family protein [Methanobacterium sp.]|uniref:YdeI/OmpD-associated family protein n=1 Tax=Methanobacterium sp. TaxID=2164 RepID=UPI003D65C9D2|nr:YdeI/OmpD-associated family protein [Methanobacterium sp.]
MSKLDQFERFEAKNRKEWHNWLQQNHLTSPGIWLIYYKKGSGKPTVSYDGAVEEALSFGWIDSKVNALDKERYMQIFTPRKPGSIWSKLNKQRVEKLVNDGLMMPAGLKKVESAKKDGSYYFLDDIEALIIPEDLKEALNANELAKKHFEAFSDSVKKQILYWIKTAKRPQTRKNRIEKTVILAAENKTPF